MEDNQPPSNVSDETEEPDTKNLVELIPKDSLQYHPLVTDPLDLHVDLSLGVILGRTESFHKKYRQGGIGLLGAVTEESEDALTSLTGMPVHLDLMSPHVLLVAGKRGSGKSYTLGIIAEELALAMERQEIEVATVMIDTVDVFRQMVDENLDQTDLLKKWGLDPKAFPAHVYIPRKTYAGLPDEVKKKSRLRPLAISPRELSVSDWGYVLEKGGQLSTAMENLIAEIIETIRKGYSLESGDRIPLKRDFSIKDMVYCIENNPTIEELYQASTRTAMIQRLKRANRLGVFLPGGTSAQDLAVGGQITIIDVAPLGSDAEAVLAILTNMLCRQVLTYRMAWTDEGSSAREELPPTWLIIDEAHTLVPRSGNTPAKDAVIGYAKLGRRFGCSLVLCTQQPSAVSDDAISQADLILSHSLSHDTDIRALQQRAPAVMPDQFKDKVFISSLPRGVALIFDQTTENKRGFIMQVRPRLSQHGGSDRLSGLFEAAHLLGTEEDVTELFDEEIEEMEHDESDTTPDVIPEDEALPDVPRPPIKLSKEDWQVLDEWMKGYVESMFEEKMQEFTVTDEPSPHSEVVEPVEETDTTSERILQIHIDASVKLDTDLSSLKVREFAFLDEDLFEKAMRRKVLYAPKSHEFLFSYESNHRDSVVLLSDVAEPVPLAEKVAAVLKKSEMDIVDIVEEDDFSFVLLRKDGIRAAFTIARSGPLVCLLVVFVGSVQRDVEGMADKIRQASVK